MTDRTLNAPARNPGFGSGVRALLELFKIRMTAHILITTVVGYYLASPPEFNWLGLGWTLAGTGLLAMAAFSFNQAIEKRHDAVMERTQKRPLPSERLGVATAWIAGTVIAALGILILWAYVNILTALLGALTVILYAAVYTPLKRLTTFNTLVGSLPGALPPLMGWTAAQNHLGTGGLLLFALLFFWQLPHFLALAWMYKEDYRRGGYRMLSLVDETGATCFRQITFQSVLLIFVSVFPFLYGIAGYWYLLVALASGLFLVILSVRLQRTGLRAHAVHVFLWSIAYIPIVLIAMALDKRMFFFLG